MSDVAIPEARPAVETLHLRREFDAVVAVTGLTLSIGGGSIFGLLGPNGAGKTSVVKMLTTLMPPTSGTARVAGFDIVREAAKVRCSPDSKSRSPAGLTARPSARSWSRPTPRSTWRAASSSAIRPSF
jgi:ABC-type Na+ transport system ATPase subunit NatA